MAELKFTHPDPQQVAWQPGEIVVVQIRKGSAKDGYVADTLETFPADIEQRHADQLEAAHLGFREQLGMKDAELAATQAALAKLERPEA